MTLLLAITGLEQGRRLLDENFEKKLKTPELSHFVLSGNRIGEKLTPHRLAQIGCEIAHSLPISRIGMIHRLGRLEIGEASVIVAASAPHRKPAFDAALEGINRLKKLVPIWKKEYFADGEVWVDGEWDDSVIKARS